MKHSFWSLIAGALLAMLTACSTTGTPNLPGDEGKFGISTDDYRVDVGDQVSINVWKHPELNITEPVRPDGKIAVHLVGDIAAAGKTPEQLADDIESELSSYVKDPNVTVILTSLAGQDYRSMIRVTGAVNSISSLKYSQGMTVLDAVLGAGGLSLYANGNRAKLHRHGKDRFSLYDLETDIGEKHDLAPKKPEIVNRYRRYFDEATKRRE